MSRQQGQEQPSYIVRDPEILGGRPVVRGTRVPVDLVFDNLADGMTIDELVEAFPTLDHEKVEGLLREAGRLLAA